jgi:hypothetical protein
MSKKIRGWDGDFLMKDAGLVDGWCNLPARAAVQADEHGSRHLCAEHCDAWMRGVRPEWLKPYLRRKE